jgi:hypothetical protein
MRKIISFALLCLCLLANSQSSNYSLVLLPQDRGAACLDGSPVGIYVNKGSGVNATKYLLFFNGNVTCAGQNLTDTQETCYQRSKTPLGTTKMDPPTRSFDNRGILSTKQSENPHFYDWTKVYVQSCD